MNNFQIVESCGYFSHHNFNQNDLADLAQYISSDHCIFHDLNLSNCQIDDDKLMILLPALLYGNHRIKSLNLRNNLLSSNVMLYLAKNLLWQDCDIIEIDLRGNNINSKTRCFINFILHVNCPRLSLYLDSGNFVINAQKIIH